MNKVNYIQANKEAWNEAQLVHTQGRKEDIVTEIQKGNYYISPEVLENLDYKGKVIGQLCCNNGRELLSLQAMGALETVGFDQADNFINEASAMAERLGFKSTFKATDIYRLEGYENFFDSVIITIGVLCWMPDLPMFFEKAAGVLKKGGSLIIHETHPFSNLFGLPGEEGYEEANPDKPVYSYFREEPLVETNGVDYVGNTKYRSKPFYSFLHTVSDILNAMTAAGLSFRKMKEYDVDIGAGFNLLDGRGIPLSFILKAEKL